MQYLETSPRRWGFGRVMQRVAALADAKEAAVAAPSDANDATLEEEKGFLEQALDAAKAELAQLKEAWAGSVPLATANSKADAALDELRAAKDADIAELRAAAEAAKAENARLTAALAASEADDALLQENKKLRDKLTELEKLRDSLRSEIDTAHADGDAAEALIKELREAAKGDKAVTDEAESELTALREQLTKARASADEFQKLHAACTGELEAAEAAAAAAATKLPSTDEAVEAEINDRATSKALETMPAREEAKAALTPQETQMVAEDEEAAGPGAVGVCVNWSPPKVAPLFTAIADVMNSKPSGSPILDHFWRCRLGLVASLDQESGLNWSLKPKKEVAAAGSTYPTWSYGIGQLRDSTLTGFRAKASLLGGFSSKIASIPKANPNGQPDAATQTALTSMSTAPYYVVLHTLLYAQMLASFWDYPLFMSTGRLVAKGNPDAAKQQSAERFADWINEYAADNADIDPVGVALRGYTRASSVNGMGNLVKKGTIEGIASRYALKYRRLLAQAPAQALIA